MSLRVRDKQLLKNYNKIWLKMVIDGYRLGNEFNGYRF